MTSVGVSPLIDDQSNDDPTTADVAPGTTLTADRKKLYIRYALIAVAVMLVVYLLYFSYSRFQINQSLSGNEPFIEKTVKTGTESDRSFDIDSEVRRLSDLQEQYLRKLNRNR